MSPSSLLLRVLLCVSLIANGIGFAQASIRMQLSHAGHGGQTAVSAQAPEECHPGMTMASHAGASTPAMEHASVDRSDMGATSDDGKAPADCCDGNACQCACTQHAPAGFLPEVSPRGHPAHAPVVVSGASQHASPRLPHLIRPPIG